jgi:RND family efflux transporter MFP subunit
VHPVRRYPWRAFSGLLALCAVIIAVVVARGRTERDAPDAAQPNRSIPSSDRSPVLLDQRRQQLAGIRTAAAVTATLSRGVRGLGTVTFDETRLTDVNLKLDGWIRTLYVNHTGQRVRQGDPLFALFSQDLIAAQLQYLAAVRSREQLSAEQAATREYEERLIETPLKRLLYWDVPQDQLRVMEKAGKPMEAVVFRSPAAGVVIKKSVTQGMHVAAGETLYTLADTSNVWVEAGFDPDSITELRRGQRATVTFDARPTEKVEGKVLLVSPSLSESKTARVRIEVSNRTGALRPGMFATVDVPAASSHGLVIPEDAVIDSGKRQTVFVATGDGHFEPRPVVLGLRGDDGRVVVVSGLNAGERVVTRATFLLDSESQLRAALDTFGGTPPSPSRDAPADRASLDLWTDPDPPHVGQNDVRVRLLDAHQAPLTDASIAVRFYMAAMPSMNMPAMHAEASLEHTGKGMYHGGSTLPMAGPWEVTVVASRNGRRIAEKTVPLLVR